MTKWVTNWAGALTIALLTFTFGYAAEVVEDLFEDDGLMLPWSPEVADIVATATLVGLASGPILALRRRSILQQTELAGATAELDRYRARERDSAQVLAGKRVHIRSCMVGDEITIVVQPIWHIVGERKLVGYEALSRFDDGRSPDTWFDEAREAGLNKELELFALRKALALLPHIPPDVYLSVNVGPETLMSEEFFLMFREVEASRYVVEITEHLHITDYDQLQRTLTRLRKLGLRLAVDDAGAGFASFRHIIQLAPDIIKLDRDLIHRCNVDAVRRTLAAALVSFAKEIGASLVAEGVETIGELETLVAMDVECAQGYYLARPAPLGEHGDQG
jgi:EAL domain-containing protein (putative c-di-GMP-specific phosphodiesterase class I)